MLAIKYKWEEYPVIPELMRSEQEQLALLKYCKNSWILLDKIRVQINIWEDLKEVLLKDLEIINIDKSK